MSLLVEHIWKVLKKSGIILHKLWLEVTGAVFIALAGFGGLSFWREFNAYPRTGEIWKPIAAIAFMAMMGFFGVYSFLKSRRLR